MKSLLAYWCTLINHQINNQTKTRLMIGDTKKTGRGFLGSVSAGRRYLQTKKEPKSTAREAMLWLHMYWWAK